MERAAWTDERLDDLAEAMRSGFDRLDQDIREVCGEIAGLRGEMHAGFDRLNSKMDRFGGGMIIALVGVIAAILARGA
jgi:hypothetical protein